MNYEEYISIIDQLMNKSDVVLKDKLLDSIIDSNLYSMIEPKLEQLIKYRFQISINKMVKNLEFMFSDINNLDQYLVNFKKEIKFIYELTNINTISENKKNELKKMLKVETEKVYDILIDKANKVDITGVLSMTIKNNRIKWSD